MTPRYPFTVRFERNDEDPGYQYTYSSLPMALPEVSIARRRQRICAELKIQANSYLWAVREE